MLSESTGMENGMRAVEASREEPIAFPASFAQDRLWFLHHLEPDVASYNIPLALRLRGRLSVRALEEGLAEILRRHDVLRTILPLREGMPVQMILPARGIEVPEVDLTQIPEAAREAEAVRLATAEAHEPFDLAQGPLFRAQRLRLGAEDQVLLMTMHHIVSDGWSVDIFLRELAALYEAYSQGKPSPLQELPIQFADYAIWQRDWMRGGVLESQLSYWRERLAGAPAVLALPTDRPRPPVQSFRGGSQSVALPAVLLPALKKLSRREGVTLFMTLLAAFQTLLYRCTGEQDILVGTPIAGRNRVETEGLVGFFVNTLVMRGDLSGNPPFREYLARVRETALGAYSHQDLPFEKLVEELQPKRSLAYTPLFQVMFQLRLATAETIAFPGLESADFQLEHRIAKFDLSLSMVERGDRLSCSFEYNLDLFEPATIRRWLERFGCLLDAIVAEPGARISELPLMPEQERHRLLVEWNDTRADFPEDRSIHELFELQVERTPEATAVVFGEESLTYRDLNARANRLAHHLRALGVGPEVPVAIGLDRSLEMVVALLAVLKAGGAYVPVDPAQPKKRLAFLLVESKAPLLLTRRRFASSFPQDGVRLLYLDAEAKRIAKESEENPASGGRPENLAYLLFTSGSTGKPRAVAVVHRGVVNHGTAVARRLGLAAGDRVLQFASFTFDVAGEELYPSLWSGATVVLRPETISPDLASFSLFLEREGLTVVNLPAGFWHEWASALSRSEAPLPPSLRLVITGSEKVFSEPLAFWQGHYGERVRWVNAYGPTEATITATTYDPSGSVTAGPLASVPIGRPIANVRCYVVDGFGQPVPEGVAGELWIGGAGLARGYWDRADLTAERFVPDPFGSKRGGRLYRTGDRARYLSDGSLDFLGRLDHQVKVRGYRVEPSEVERALLEHPQVSECVVLVREAADGQRRLVAYLVLAGQREPSVSDLRRFLKQRLPDYMVPSAFVGVEALPKTSRGKIDRGELPALEPSRADLEEAYVAPRDSLEWQLAKIWETVLQVAPVGVRDDFFELGGHSLLAVKLFARIETVIGKKLPLATFFQAGTVEQLARVLREDGWKAPWSSLVAIQAGGSKPPFYCVHAAGGNVLTYRDLARHLGPDQPVYGLQAAGLEGKAPAHNRVEDMAAHYVREIRSLQPEGPYHLGGSSFGGVIAFEMARQLRAQGQRVGVLALFDTHGPGYPRRLPNTSRFRLRIDRLLKRIDLHVGNLLVGSPGAKISYFLEKSRRLKRRTRQRLRKALRRNALPRTLRDVEDASRRALFRYVPLVYPGKVTLFRATKQPTWVYPDRTLGWSRVAEEGVEIYDVPGHHGAIVYEPRVAALAKQLTLCLRRAGAAESGVEPAAAPRQEGPSTSVSASSPLLAGPRLPKA